jgi:putative acetyltransferase
MLIRRETDADIASIDAVHHAAFSRDGTTEPPEVELVRRLRADHGWVPALSLVADHPTDGLVGHVVCTVGSIDGHDALGLGPLGVHSAHQRTGVGHALMHAVLGAADALEYGVVVLLGHVEYYWRFGFVPARRFGIEPPEPAWDDHFQARPLHAWHDGLRGTFRYAAPFDRL